MKILVINGPNLNFLGIREKKIYGTQDYQYLLDLIDKKAKETGEEIQVFQSNHEGAIIDRIQEAYSDGTEGIVINPGAYTHYSYAIRDALASVDIPKVEIHISDITSREEFRKISVTKRVKWSVTAAIVLMIAGMIAYPQIKSRMKASKDAAEVVPPAGSQVRKQVLNINAEVLKYQSLTDKTIVTGSTIPDEEGRPLVRIVGQDRGHLFYGRYACESR